MKTRSQETSIPEEIPEEYVNDTFESLDSSLTPTHSTPLRKDLLVQRDISQSPSASRRSSNDGSKSEEEASMTGELGTSGCMISSCVFFSLHPSRGKRCKL